MKDATTVLWFDVEERYKTRQSKGRVLIEKSEFAQ